MEVSASVNERIAKLEAHEETLFDMIDEIKEEVKTLNRLTVAVEKIAIQTESTAKKVDNIDLRLDTLEREPGQRLISIKTTIVTTAIAALIGSFFTAVLALVMK